MEGLPQEAGYMTASVPKRVVPPESPLTARAGLYMYLPLRHSARRDFAGGFGVTAFRSPFPSLSVSRPSGERASPRHLRERNRTSTAPKLSKTLRSRPFIPDAHRHFEG